MNHTTTVIIGGGQAGLSLSRCLTDTGIDHVVLERGQVAQRWHERWDSLRLLTPNWFTRLPGWTYDGPDPDGFMTAAQTADFFGRYAASFGAPVREHTTVWGVTGHGHGFVVDTDGGTVHCDNVVVATGWSDRPAVPATARRLSPAIAQITPDSYRRPADLAGGGVLVVGASATGVQLADELHRSGRPVTLAVGSHSRMPRRYRGMDAFWWLDQIGSFDKTIDDCADPLAARREPSLQLVGRPDHVTLDLTTLHSLGVRLVGRLNGVDGARARFGTDLDAVVADADRRLGRTLARIDAAIDRLGLRGEVHDPAPLPQLPTLDPPSEVHLARSGIRSIVWATGYRRSYDWLHLPVFDGRGEIVQRRGVTLVPGVYVLGQRFQHFRSSNFIDGVGRDARYVADHIAQRVHHPEVVVPEPERIAS